MNRPLPSEANQYYHHYFSLVPEGNVLEIMEEQRKNTLELFKSISHDKENFRYADGKWTIKELFGHLIDTERVFAYRAMCFARGEAGRLPGFDENQYVANGNFSTRTLADLASEYDNLRKSNLVLFQNFQPESLDRKGNANGFDITVRALIWALAGHEIHHKRILKERYLSAELSSANPS